MDIDSASDKQRDDPTPRCAPQTFARRGALIGCVLGLLVVWRIMSGAIDPTVSDHSPIFPAAVTIVCIFAVVVLLVLSLIGHAIGACIKRNPSILHDDSRSHQELGE